MNFEEFYKQVSRKSNNKYDEHLIRIVYNHFFKSVKESMSEDNVIINIENFGKFHIDIKKVKQYVETQSKPSDRFKQLYINSLKHKTLTKYLNNDSESELQSSSDE